MYVRQGWSASTKETQQGGLGKEESTILRHFFFLLKPRDYLHTNTRQNTISKVEDEADQRKTVHQ